MYRVMTKEEFAKFAPTYHFETFYYLFDFVKKYGGMECFANDDKSYKDVEYYLVVEQKSLNERGVYEKVCIPSVVVKQVETTWVWQKEKSNYEFTSIAFGRKVECKPVDDIPTIQATISAEELMKQWQKVIKEGSEDMKGIKDMIKSVHFNEKKGVTTVVLTNGAKGISRASGGDQYDKYIGFAMALQNALFGSRTQAIKFIDEKYNNQMRIEKAKLKAKIKKTEKRRAEEIEHDDNPYSVNYPEPPYKELKKYGGNKDE